MGQVRPTAPRSRMQLGRSREIRAAGVQKLVATPVVQTADNIYRSDADRRLRSELDHALGLALFVVIVKRRGP